MSQKKNVEKIFLNYKITNVIHFAAQSLVLDGYKFPEKTFETNFNGTLNNLNIYSKAFNQTQIQNISSSINASPYIGNIF